MLLTITGLRIHVQDEGPREAAPVLLLHAFPLSGAMWAPQVEALRHRWRVLVPDMRGMGRSECGDGQHTLEHFADDVLAMLDALEIPRAAICGLSMGSYLALRLVERAPERVLALILANTRSEADSNPARLNRAAALRAVKEKGVAAFAEGFVKSAMSAATHQAHPEVVAQARAIIEANTPQGIGGAILALVSRTDTTESLAQIPVPTLVIAGSEDSLTPPNLAQSVAGRIPGARLTVIPGVGHLSNLEAPEAFNQAVLEFLGSVK